MVGLIGHMHDESGHSTTAKSRIKGGSEKPRLLFSMTYANFNFTTWPVSFVLLCVVAATYTVWLVWVIRKHR